jgi:2-polyprenyl-6-methoxyphenol hydroxylase-like FAD-dependent oxidoreductase
MGLAAGYHWPQYSLHRGELQALLLEAVRERAVPVRTGLRLEDLRQDGDGVTAVLRGAGTGATRTERAEVLIGADGVHSRVRALLGVGPDPLLWSGIRMWRGVHEGEPFLDGATVLVAGSNLAAKFVAYPVSVPGRKPALINWVAEVAVGAAGVAGEADWSREGRARDVIAHFADWDYPHLDVRATIEGTARVLEYPMVDRDPLPRWSRGRVTLLGDAAHPMYPVGSNNGSQAILDARVLARCLATEGDPAEGLAAYERERREATGALVLAHRALPMEETIRLITERAPHGFGHIAEVLTPPELENLGGAQRRITDMDVEALNARPSWNVSR